MAERLAVHERDEMLADGAGVRPVEAEGPGVLALRTLFASGEPKPARVVEILDKHRSERDALFAFLQTHAGNGYVARVQAEMDDLRVSIERREVVAGDPASPTDGFFHGSAERRGAAWRTDSGRFSGEIDQSRTAMRYQHDEDTSLRADVDHRGRTGSVTLEDEGRTVGALEGSYRGSDDWQVGVTRPLELGEGRSGSVGLRHQVRPGHGASDVLAGSYRSGSTTADGFIGRHESGGLAAGGTFESALDDRTRISGAGEHSAAGTTAHVTGTRQLGDERSVTGTYRHASTPEAGSTDTLTAGYRSPTTTVDGHVGRSREGLTAGGSFTHALDERTSLTGAAERTPTGTTGHLTGTHQLGDERSITGTYRHASTEAGATDTLSAGYRSPTTTAEGHVARSGEGLSAGGTFSHALDERTALTGALEHSPTATSGHLTGTRQLGDDRSITGSLRRQTRPEHGTSDVLAAGYRDPTTTVEGYAGRHESGGFAAGGSFTRTGERSSMTGAFDHSPLGTSASFTGSARPSDRLTLSGTASHVDRRHGADVSSLTISEQYRSDTLAHRMDLTAERGAEGTTARGSGSLDMRLGPRMYAGAFGSFDTTAGGSHTMGASLTFTPQEKTALTIAGIVDGNGAFETRLQLDVFKSRIEGLSTIADHKKDALVSLYLAYTKGGPAGMLDDRFGRSQYGGSRATGEGTVSAGIRLRF